MPGATKMAGAAAARSLLMTSGFGSHHHLARQFAHFRSSCVPKHLLLGPSVTRYLAFDNTQFHQAYSTDNAKKDLQKAMQYTQHIGEGPLPALVLGGAGLLPFVSVPLMCLGGSFDPCWAFNQLAYGASILSFMGGARWAKELKLGNGGNSDADYSSLGIAVTPAIAAWMSLMMPVTLGYLTVGGGLIAIAYLDIFSSSYPRWYKGLRGALTAVAVGSLLLTLIFRMILKEKQHKKNAGTDPHQSHH